MNFKHWPDVLPFTETVGKYFWRPAVVCLKLTLIIGDASSVSYESEEEEENANTTTC